MLFGAAFGRYGLRAHRRHRDVEYGTDVGHDPAEMHPGPAGLSAGEAAGFGGEALVRSQHGHQTAF